MASLAYAAMAMVADAQNARNSIFTDSASSPVVILLVMTVTAALQQFLNWEGNPITDLSPTLVAFLNEMGPLAAESAAAMSEGDFQWNEGPTFPCSQEVQRLMELLRAELELNIETVAQYRLTLFGDMGQRFDRRLYAVILALDEVRYYENIPVLNLLQTTFSRFQWRAQSALVEQGRGQRPSSSMDGHQ